MNLFSVHMLEARGIYRTVCATAFRHCLEAVAAAAGSALDDKATKLAYLGSGRFAGIVRGRARLDTAALAHTMNAALAKDWDSLASRLPAAPKLDVKPISTQRIWSGLSASDRLRQHEAETDPRTQVTIVDEQGLFARLENFMSRK
jgi:hypothetical protein